MMVENTKENRNIQRAVASLAIDNMYVEKEFIKELIKVANGEKRSEELRKKVIQKWRREDGRCEG